MGSMSMKNKMEKLKNRILTIGILFILLLAVILVIKQPKQVQQASDPLFPTVKFQGEYKIADGEWVAIQEGQHISATKGDVYLKGNFKWYMPETMEPMGNVPAETVISLYLNHLNMCIYKDEQLMYQSSVEDPKLRMITCAQIWEEYMITDEEEVTVVLTNPHKYGNENAVDEFLNSPALYVGGENIQKRLEQGSVQRTLGIVIFIAAIAILGMSLFASQIKVESSKEIAIAGCVILFAAGYYFFSSKNICLFHEDYRINTVALCLCKELYMLFSTVMIWKGLKSKSGKAGKVLLWISLIAMLVLILLSLTEQMYFYDGWCVWSLIEVFICIGLIICIFVDMKINGKENLHIYSISFCILLCYILDFVAGYFGWWESQFLSMVFFFFIFAGAVLVTLKLLPQNMIAHARAKELEMEKKVLQAELKESRISVMMSQIQPHFLYNSLGVIQELCHENPQKAEKAIENMAEFLKGNMTVLLSDKVVSFGDELNHTKKYLEMEYLRFEDQLSVIYEINVDDFCLPALTLQPIVENAVRYGVRKNEEGGTIRISTRENKEFYEVIVQDDGPGLNPDESNMGDGMHIGIKNVRERLIHICGGELLLETEPGKGTCVTIRVRKD
jgi:hypothetical protein